MAVTHSSVSVIMAIIVIMTAVNLRVAAFDMSTNTTEVHQGISTSFEFLNGSTVASDLEDGSSEWVWYPLRWSWWLVLQVIAAIIGIIGNGVVIVVIHQRSATIRSTDILIGALAIADFLTSIFLFPIPWASRVPATILGSLYCKFIYTSFFFWLCIVASTYLLMAICIERYIALVYPLYFNRVITKRRTNYCVLGVWVFSILQTLYSLFIFVYDDNINYCANSIPSIAGKRARAYYAFITRLVLPVITMLITQILIAISLHHQAKQFQQMFRSGKGSVDSSTSFHVVARNRVLKIMLVVVLIYVVTWTPNQIAYFCYNLGYISSSYRGSPLHRILTVIGFMNACVNPFIYAARNPQFRAAVKDLFTCVKPLNESLFESGNVSTKATKNTHESSVQNA